MINLEIDWEKVGEIVDKYKLSSVDNRMVRQLILDSLDQWWEHDKEHFNLVGSEIEFLEPISATNSLKFKGFIDLVFKVKKVPKYMVRFGVKVGDEVVADWKTTNINLGTSYGTGKFKELYESSLQWKGYVVYGRPSATAFLYRGVSKAPEGGFHSILCIPFKGMGDEVQQQLEAHGRAILSQYGLVSPWVKDMPKGCNTYECPYQKTCRLGTPQEFIFDPKPLVHLSHSSIETFRACPERWRRDRLEIEGLIDEVSDNAEFGKAFHEAMAHIYKEGFNV